MNILLGKVFIKQHIIQGQLFIAGETFTDVSLFLLIQILDKLHQLVKGFFYRSSVLFSVICDDNFLIPLVIFDSVGIIKQQCFQPHLYQLLQIPHNQILFLCLGKLPTQEIEVNLADVKPFGLCQTFRLLFDMNIFADDIIDLNHQIHIACMLSLFLQFIINRSDCIISFPGNDIHIFPVCILHQPVQFAGIGLEFFLFLQCNRNCICCHLHQMELFKILCMDDRLQRTAMLCQKGFSHIQNLVNSGDQLFLVYRGISPATSEIRCVICQCLSQCFHDTDIIHDQTIALSFRNTVGTGDGLHQRVRFQGLVQVQAA